MGTERSRRIVYQGPVAGLPGVAMFGFDIFRKAGRLGRHTHAGYELVLLVSGRVRWEVEGRRYQLRGGELWVARPGEMHHGVGEVMNPCELFWLVVVPTPGGLTMSRDEAATVTDALRNGPRIVPAPPGIDEVLARAMGELKAGETAAARGLLVHAVAVMARAFARRTRPRARSLPPGIQRALGVIDDSLSAPPSVPALAAEIGLSPSRLSALFRRHVGMSPADYVMSRRIEVACDRLSRTRASVTAIGLDLGFSSTQHFCDAFRKRMGASPTAYRRQASPPR